MDLAERVKAIPYWYHKIELPDGIVTPGWAPICAEKYAILDDLTGKRVLDIGAWDGYWTWEALKRGAKEVVAIDDFSDTLGQPIKRMAWETFDICREAFGFTESAESNNVLDIHRYDDRDPKTTVIPMAVALAPAWRNGAGAVVRRVELSIYEIAEYVIGRFDIVFFFGTLYHLKHPLLALEKISQICDGEIYIESAICDDFSPYRGGLEKGYHDNDMVTEFYPNNEYGGNPSNWWVPTLQCLGYMTQAAGFANVELWRLTENPKDAGQCRGFVYASKAEGEAPANVKKQAQTQKVLSRHSKVFAVMSIPRLGFQDNQFCAMEALVPLKIPLIKVQGAFWGQCLERGLMTQIDAGAEILLTIDYDTIFKKEDLQELIALMDSHPEVDALVPVQVGRHGKKTLCTMRSKSGQWMEFVPVECFAQEIQSISTGHFGLTLIRTSALMKLPHPWFIGQPDKDGQWGRDRVDEDIYFWRHFKANGSKAYMANRVVIGHLELMALWPDTNMNIIYQQPKEFFESGKLQNVWK